MTFFVSIRPLPPSRQLQPPLDGAAESPCVAHLRETDCVAGHVRFELRNVVANYPFERSHRFAGIQPIWATETIRELRRWVIRSSCEISAGVLRGQFAIEAHCLDSRNCRDFAPRRVGELRDATASKAWQR
jgi:hypothetical protein